MAIKDWKKYGGTIINPRWKNKKTGEIVEIGDEGKGIIDIDLNPRDVQRSVWFVLMHKVKEPWRSSKNFKTKSQALAYAKAYMRKH